MSELFGVPGEVRQILGLVRQILENTETIMSQDQTIASEAAAEEVSISQIGTALASVQQLLVTLQGEQGLSAATLAAAAKVQTDLQALATTAQADATADQPPAATTPPAPAS